VAAGGKTFARTRPHACARGTRYFSYVRILGQPWDLGAFTICR
jgi:hypothetical protein